MFLRLLYFDVRCTEENFMQNLKDKLIMFPIQSRKKFTLWTIGVGIFLLCYLQSPSITLYKESKIDRIQEYKYNKKGDSNWRDFTTAEKANLSTLGRILFLGENPPPYDKTKKYKILIWKYGSTIYKRHLKNYGTDKSEIYKYCSVSNCDISFKDKDLETADLVLFHMHRMKGLADLPKTKRSETQLWAFMIDESPYNTFLNNNIKIKIFNGVFNWSMTYRSNSDIPVPYGRAVKLNKIENFYFENQVSYRKRDVLVAILGSNCKGIKNHRWDYVKKLQKYIKVDIYGKCGSLKCPGHFHDDCHLIDNYMFYLSFENTNCDEYVTEKVWWNAYHKGSIPIIMGADRNSYKKILPPDSYLHVEEYASPEDLARHIIRLNQTDEYKMYHDWRYQYSVLNEHGYFMSPSFHFCRACEALNYNKKRSKVYNNLQNYWNTSTSCFGN